MLSNAGGTMKCFYCNAEVIWNSDYDTNEDNMYNIVSTYKCNECDTWYEVFHEKKEKKNDK